VLDGDNDDLLVEHRVCDDIWRIGDDQLAGVLDAAGPPAIGPAAGYTEDDLARDLGIDPRDRALPRAVSAYADAFTGSFWQETGRAARGHCG